MVNQSIDSVVKDGITDLSLFKKSKSAAVMMLLDVGGG